MKRLLLALALLIASPCLGAIAHDADSNAGSAVGNVSSFSWSHTCTGSNLELVVRILIRSNAGSGNTVATGITYNSVAMTESTSRIAPGAGTLPNFTYTSIWTLKAPATGLHTIAVTLNNTPGGTDVYASATSFTGVDQTTPVEAQATPTNGVAAPITISITTVNANAWIVDALCLDQNIGSGTVTANSPQVKDYQGPLGPTASLSTSYQGPIVTPASTADGYTYNMTISGWQMVAISLKPAAGATNHTQQVGAFLVN